MVRGLVVVVLTVALAAAAALSYRWLATEQVRSGEEAVTDCYPLQQACRWQMPDGEASVAMTPLEGDELLMTVTLPGVSDPVIVILTGESMYMGEYPMRMESTGEQGVFRASLVPPFCSTGDDMTWRVNLRVGTEAISLPFRLLFSH